MTPQAKDKRQSDRRWKRRDFLRATAGTLVALLLPGCQRTLPSTATPLPTDWIETDRYRRSLPWRIGRSGRGDINPWMVMFSAHIEYGIVEKHREHFKDYFCTSGNWDPNKQIEDIRILLREGIDLLLIDPMDTTVVAAGVREAMNAGVPAILASTRVAAAPYVSWVTTNEEERGAACAEWMCRSINGGRIAVLVSVPAAGPGDLWLEGVKRQLDDRANVETIIARSPWSTAGAKEVMASTLDEYTPIDGVIVQSGVLGRGVVQAFVERGREIPPIAGGDDWNGWLRAAKEYGVRFMGLSGGANLGLRAVDLATNVLAGQRVPRYVEFAYEVFDDSELGRYYRPDLSDHFWAVNDLPEAWIERMFRP
jgi:ribose transport system substrate-binding protein